MFTDFNYITRDLNRLRFIHTSLLDTGILLIKCSGSLWYFLLTLITSSRWWAHTSSNQKLWECVRRRINFYTDTLNDFPSWLSTSKNQPYFINNRGFTERYFSDKVHAILIEEVPVQSTLRDRASFRRLASLKRLKYLHQPSNFVLNILTSTFNVWA